MCDGGIAAKAKGKWVRPGGAKENRSSGVQRSVEEKKGGGGNDKWGKPGDGQTR